MVAKVCRTWRPSELAVIGSKFLECHSHESKVHFLWYSRKFCESLTFSIDFEISLSFCYDRQWKYLWHFVLLKRSNTCHNPHFPTSKKIDDWQNINRKLMFCWMHYLLFAHYFIQRLCREQWVQLVKTAQTTKKWCSRKNKKFTFLSMVRVASITYLWLKIFF